MTELDDRIAELEREVYRPIEHAVIQGEIQAMVEVFKGIVEENGGVVFELPDVSAP